MQQLTKSLLPNKVLKATFYIYFTLLFYFTLSPVKNVPSSFLVEYHIPHLDKWVHFFAFIILIVLYKLAFPFKSIYLGIGLSIIVAILIELLQGYMNLGRTADIYDLIADLAGTSLGLVLLNLLNRCKKRKIST